MKALAILVAAAAASAAHAGGYAVSEQTAVSAGTGGAGAARDGDPGAAWHNPSALADGGGLRVDLSLIVARPSLDARALDGSWDASNDASWATPPHLDASYARGRWAAGLSLGVPFGSGVAWPASWPGRHELRSAELMVLRAAPFFAWRFGALRVSAGFHVDRARLQLARDLDFIDTTGDVAIDLDGTGAGGHASLFYQRGAVALGLVYRSRTRLRLTGGASFTAPPAFGEKAADQRASSVMTLPDQIVIGARFRTGGGVTLHAEVERTLWRTHARTVIDFEREMTTDVTQHHGWADAVALRLGTEWARGRFVARGGMYTETSPAPSDRLSPASPDGTRLGLAAGAGWRFDAQWSIDAFLESLSIFRRDSTNPDAIDASYGGRAVFAGLGVRWTPGHFTK